MRTQDIVGEFISGAIDLLLELDEGQSLTRGDVQAQRFLEDVYILRVYNSGYWEEVGRRTKDQIAKWNDAAF